MKNLFDLKGKKALVTGGSQGLGFAIAKGLADHGADTAIMARDKKRLSSAKKKLVKTGRKIWTYSFDLEETEAIPDMFKKICREIKGIDILVNNAGINIRKDAEKFKLEEFNKIIKVNLTSVFVLSQCFAECHKKNKKPGRIINISSLAAENARAKIAPYNASKGGVKQLTKSLAVELARYNINVNAIGPGYFATEMNRPLFEDKKFDKWVREQCPQSRWGKPEELAGAAVFLASDAANFITGQSIYVDGGWLAKI